MDPADPIPAVHEETVTDETAAIFADLRTVIAG